ncbi:hypothetical protein [Salinifilum ghardaiensis]
MQGGQRGAQLRQAHVLRVALRMQRSSAEVVDDEHALPVGVAQLRRARGRGWLRDGAVHRDLVGEPATPVRIEAGQLLGHHRMPVEVAGRDEGLVGTGQLRLGNEPLRNGICLILPGGRQRCSD